MKALKPGIAARLVLVVVMLWLWSALSASAQEKPATLTAQLSSTGQNPPSVPAPTINAIQPGVPFNIPNQTLTVTGSNFQDGATLTLEDPQGNSVAVPQEHILSIKPTNMVLTATLDTVGKWNLKITNPKGEPSALFEFSVAAFPAINPDSPAVKSYWWAFWVSTGALTALFLVVVCSLLRYMYKDKWSLGDALSEESSIQPKEIHGRKDVIMVASSSRLIALLGLLGILTIVLGIGFSVIWNLFVYGTVPQLTQVRSFLYGAACLFAPYLANQLRSVFDSSSGNGAATLPSTPAAGEISITGISPTRPLKQAVSQVLRITGSGFREDLTVTFTQPDGTTLAHPPVESVDPTLVVTHATLDTPGNWKVAITNQGGNPSAPFGFTVVGPATIIRIDPAAIVHAAAPRIITIVGSGFGSDLTVSLRRPDNTVIKIPAAASVVTAGEVRVNAILDVPGNWTAIVTNPGPNAVEFQFTIT